MSLPLRAARSRLEIHVHGQATPIIGPFTQLHGRDAQLGEDGSTAMLVWKDEDEKIPQLVVTDASGKLSFRVDCEATDRSPTPGPDGAGAVVPEPGASATSQLGTVVRMSGKGIGPLS